MKNIKFLAIIIGAIATNFALGFVSFPAPTFKSEWITLTSLNTSTSYRRIVHGLNEVPLIVKVLVKVTDGPNKDYIFEAGGSMQSDDDLDLPRGGVSFMYNSSAVYVWSATPSSYNTKIAVYPVLIGGTWGSGTYAQTTDSVLIQVQLWLKKDFYIPEFVSDVITMGTGNDTEVTYNFTETPVMVNVISNFTIAGETWYFVGTGSQQTRSDHKYDNSGGLLYAYSSRSARLWSTVNHIFCSNDGWGHNANIYDVKTADVRVYAWQKWKCLNPHFDSDWFDVNQTAQRFYELKYGECGSTRHVDVQLLAVDGANKGFIFNGVGMAQTLKKRRSQDAAGGVVFAHSTRAIRLWMTYSPSDPTRGLITVQGWGSTHQQLSSTGKLRVRVWCENNAGTPRWVPSGTYLTATGGGTLNSTLMTMSSANASLVQCAWLCKQVICCTCLSLRDGVCTVYGELEFGKAAAQPEPRGLYCLNTNPCTP